MKKADEKKYERVDLKRIDVIDVLQSIDIRSFKKEIFVVELLLHWKVGNGEKSCSRVILGNWFAFNVDFSYLTVF